MTGLRAKPLDFDRNLLKYNQEHFDTLRRWATDNYEHFEGTANFAFLDAAGTVSPRENRACHANMAGSKSFTTQIMFTENASRRQGRIQETEGFLTFLLSTDNPYHELILNRADVAFCRDYGFIIQANAPQPMVMNLCIMTRHFKEVSQGSFFWFDRAVAKGIHPYIAYEFAMNSGLSMSGLGDVNSKEPYKGYGGHRVAVARGLHGFLKYFRGEAGKEVNMGLMPEVDAIFGASKLFSGGLLEDSCAEFPELQGKLAEFRGKGKKADFYKPPNPFAPARYRPKKIEENDFRKFTYEEAVQVVLPFLQNEAAKELAKNG